MNITLVVLVVEVFVILFGAVGYLFFLRWKRGKVKTAEFEELLDNVSSKDDERKAQLIQFLEESHALKTDAAEESAGCMIEAEKQFLQQFIKQQLEQTSITEFYVNLCELLDNYLYFVPTIHSEQQDDVEVEVEVLNTDSEDEEDLDLEDPEAMDLAETDSDEKEQVSEPDEAEVTEESSEEHKDLGGGI